MIKIEILSYVKGFLPAEDATQRFHSGWLTRVIERVILEMYSDLYERNPRLLDLYTKQFGVTSPIAIEQDAATGIYYSTLPCKIVNLPCKGSGVRHIYPLVQTGNVFVPMSATEADIIFNTDIAVVSSKVGYNVRQDTRVDYYGAAGLYAISQKVRMDLLIPFSEYSDTDVVMIPDLTNSDAPTARYGTRAPSYTFIDRVLGVLQVVPPADLSDDNSAQQEPKRNNKQ